MSITINFFEKTKSSNQLLESLNDANYFILDEFENKKEYYDAVKQVLLDGIEKLEGARCRQLVEKYGLCKLHEYFPADKLADLDLFVKGSHQIKKIMLQLTFSVGTNNLQISDEFFMEGNPFAFKISYPHQVAIQSKVTNADYHHKYSELRKKICLEENLKWQLRQTEIKFRGLNIDTLAQTVKSLTKIVVGKIKTFIQSHQKKTLHTYPGFERIAKQPYAAKVHQPHIDSWYGAPLGGTTLWWAIEGATEDNGVVLYPDFFGQAIDFRDIAASSSYLPFGITVTKPHKISVPDGSILLFNYDMLHSSHLNISDYTRIAIISQIYLKLEFNSDALHERGSGFYSSKDIAKGDLENLIKVSMREHFDELHKGKQKPHVEKRISVKVNSDLSAKTPIALCNSDTLGIGEKMLINLRNESVIAIRNANGLRVVSAICPHMGINLIDGFHDEQHIYCPGHGVAYCLIDGSSKCDLLKLEVYHAYDRNGVIFLEKVTSEV
ncbi:Rieske 2Fe-2S domain-containing protein [Candidatus Gracilibacteria bacterium]|nr:Rieske 2Fe-2S domain-containing protein [Candidatus Gracilibacteria bacterium]NJM89443.1 Rieske 2Fe-2S domain-containing protein [Hydrococcus sp. RU_2_2]